MSAKGYAILDEPQPGTLQQWTVNPLWPFFALMFAGDWLALPWFAFNAAAMGSATRRREWTLLALALPVKVVLFLGLGMLHQQSGMPEGAIRYLVVSVTVLKLGVGYWLFHLQSRSFALYQYFEGPVRNGVLLVVGGALMHQRVLGLFGGGWLWQMIVF